MTELDSGKQTKPTASGNGVILLLLLGLVASPFLLTLSPLIPVGALVYLGVRKAAYGASWKRVWVAAWVALVISCWPLLGLDVGQVMPS